MEKTHIVRLTTGEELLCNIDNHSDDILTVKHPFVILPTADGNISFMKYMPYAVYHTLPIKETDVMWIVEPNPELTSKHQEMTGSIVTPNKQIVT